MGEVHAEITIENLKDHLLFEEGLMPENEMRSATVTALVDTGTMHLVIGDKLRRQLGLDIKKPKTFTLAGGSKVDGGIIGPLNIRWKDREFIGSAYVLPEQDEVLLGVVPLEQLDLIVDPVNQELIGKHGDKPVFSASGYVKLVQTDE